MFSLQGHHPGGAVVKGAVQPLRCGPPSSEGRGQGWGQRRPESEWKGRAGRGSRCCPGHWGGVTGPAVGPWTRTLVGAAGVWCPACAARPDGSFAGCGVPLRVKARGSVPSTPGSCRGCLVTPGPKNSLRSEPRVQFGSTISDSAVSSKQGPLLQWDRALARGARAGDSSASSLCTCHATPPGSVASVSSRQEWAWRGQKGQGSVPWDPVGLATDSFPREVCLDDAQTASGPQEHTLTLGLSSRERVPTWLPALKVGAELIGAPATPMCVALKGSPDMGHPGLTLGKSHSNGSESASLGPWHVQDPRGQ